MRVKGDSCGGVVTCVCRGVPRGLGAPVFDKLEADLAHAMMSLPATKGFEVGSGFSGTLMKGTEHNDEFYMARFCVCCAALCCAVLLLCCAVAVLSCVWGGCARDEWKGRTTYVRGSPSLSAPLPQDSNGLLRTRTNRSGGIQGGISNGENIVLKIAFKPTSTVTQSQRTVNRAGQETDLRARGRHDPCVVPRAVPMVEAMAALVLVDHLMQQYAQCNLIGAPAQTCIASGYWAPFPRGARCAVV